MAKLLKYRILDDLNSADKNAIEVEFELDNGQKRWAFFFTPQGIVSCGDWIPETKVRVHLGVPHMIVVSEISEEIIEKTVQMLENEDLIELNTKAFTEE